MNKQNLEKLIYHQHLEIYDNSKYVTPGSVFVAIRGTHENGELFINQALNKGAQYIVVDDQYTVQKNNNQYIYVKNTRQYLSKISSIKYYRKPQNIVSVTGTNGKTSTAHFFQQISNYMKYKTCSIGTLGIVTDKYQSSVPNNLNNCPLLTTPPPLKLHSTLEQLAKKNYKSVIVEASSHGIYQHRLDYINFNAVAFTNMHQDHFDYHTNKVNYFNAKSRIFREILKPGHTAVLNCDIPEFSALKEICISRSIKILDYGVKSQKLKITSITKQEINVFGYKCYIGNKIKGIFQLYNILAAIGLCIACNYNPIQIIKHLNKLQSPKGRLELITCFKNAKIYIDYAHNPEAFQQVLNELRKDCSGKLHVVFGCGGNRDKNKRGTMGSIAQSTADIIYITDDNPRNEEAKSIRNDILKSCPNALEIDDRKKAIISAIDRLAANDILLITGKGHEEYQIIGNKKNFYSDHQVVYNKTMFYPHKEKQ